MTLLRHNLLQHILRRPGAAALPDSPGEAISRFRGDVFEMPLFALWMNDLLGSIAYCVVAMIIMAHINARITALAILPFIVVGIVANATAKRVSAYRRASRRAAGIVSGFIGELFGAVQAVKVATAEREVIAHFHTLNEDRRDGFAERPPVQRNAQLDLPQCHQYRHRHHPHPGRPGHATEHLHAWATSRSLSFTWASSAS